VFRLAPLGIEVAEAQSVKLVVLADVAPPELVPTATQVVRVEHEIAFHPFTFGLFSWPHGPSSVPIMAGAPFTTPIAAHVTAFEHETIDNDSIPDGGACDVQLKPFVVP
jgi:hypothetical protein